MFSKLLSCGSIVEIFCVVPLFDDLRDDLVKVTNETVVSDFHHRAVRVFVDCNDDLGTGHTSLVLNSSGDTASEVDLRLNGCSGLSYLM